MQKIVTIYKDNEVNLTDVAIAVDWNGMCHLSLDDGFDESKGWECSIVCKKFTKEQKEALLLLKGTFDKVGSILWTGPWLMDRTGILRTNTFSD